MTFFNKIKWILGISLVFFIILATNLIDRNNFVIVKNSVESIYADRLVAQDIIMDLTILMWEKKAAYIQLDQAQFEEKNSTINTRLDELMELFSTTRLTRKEEVVFGQLEKNLSHLVQQEAGLAEQPISDQAYEDQIALIKNNLDDLSAIQLKEGRRQLLESQRAVDTVDLFTHLEIYALIILAIIIQILVMYNPTSEESPPTT